MVWPTADGLHASCPLLLRQGRVKACVTKCCGGCQHSVLASLHPSRTNDAEQLVDLSPIRLAPGLTMHVCVWEILSFVASVAADG